MKIANRKIVSFVDENGVSFISLVLDGSFEITENGKKCMINAIYLNKQFTYPHRIINVKSTKIAFINDTNDESFISTYRDSGVINVNQHYKILYYYAKSIMAYTLEDSLIPQGYSVVDNSILRSNTSQFRYFYLWTQLQNAEDLSIISENFMNI